MNTCARTPPSRLRTIGIYLIGTSRIALLMGLGDILGQHYYRNVNNIQDVNWRRTAEYTTMGFCFMGPALTYWGRMMRTWVTQNQKATAVKQILTDQIYLAPSLNLGLTIMSDIVQFKGHEHIEHTVAEKYMSLLKQHYLFWPMVQTFCTFLVQPKFQLLCANVIAVGWFAYISNKYHPYYDINSNSNINDNNNNKNIDKKEGAAINCKKSKRFILL